MEECTRSKPTKLSAFKKRFQGHGAIVRSLSPFFVRAARLESGDANAGRLSLLAISGSCVCASSTSAVIDAQVPCHRLTAQDADSPHGNSKNRYNASKSSAQKEIPKKSRFSNSFNKGYARVSDVSSTISCHTGDALMISPKSGDEVDNSSRRLVINLNRRMEDDTAGHGKPNFRNSPKNANSRKTDDSGGCCRSELSLRTHSEQGLLCKRQKVNFAYKGYLPVMEYTWDPCKAFYESMLEMVTVDVYDDDDLEDMFVYYLELNSSHHHAHIKEAFTILLTHLYKSKLLLMS